MPDYKIHPHTFKPHGETDFFGHPISDADIIHIEVDGIEYMTDRFVLIRADLVEPKPRPEQIMKISEETAKGVVEFVTKALAEPQVETATRKLAPMFVADMEDAGLQLIPTAKVWQIKLGDLIVGCIAPVTPNSTDDTVSQQGFLPGEIRPEHRAAYAILADEIENRWDAWQATANVVDAVKAAL